MVDIRGCSRAAGGTRGTKGRERLQAWICQTTFVSVGMAFFRHTAEYCSVPYTVPENKTHNVQLAASVPNYIIGVPGEIRILTGAVTGAERERIYVPRASCFVRAYLWFNCVLMCFPLPPRHGTIDQFVNLGVGLYD